MFIQTHPLKTLLVSAMLAGAGFVPLIASASTAPTCTMALVTPHGATITNNHSSVLVSSGERLQILWISADSQATVGPEGKPVRVFGVVAAIPKVSTTYTYTFLNGDASTACSITADVGSGSITAPWLASNGSDQSLSGTASGVSAVSFSLMTQGTNPQTVFEQKNIAVSQGSWSVTIPGSLSSGTYNAILRGDGAYDVSTLATGTVTIGTAGIPVTQPPASSNGVLTASVIPLLSGGTTGSNTTVPVAYIELENKTSEAVHVTGFDVQQNGSASDSAIASLSTVDDKGGSRAVSATSPFSSGHAFVPTDATIGPKAIKLFTIKATTSASLGSDIGRNLMLVVTGIESNGKAIGQFPLPGTTWTLSY